MPDGEKKWWQWEWTSPGRVPLNERRAFEKWYFVRRGLRWWSGMAATTPSFRTDNPFYQEWLSTGKETAEEWRARQEKIRFKRLEPWEKRAELGEVSFYLNEYPEPPYPLAEGMEWVKKILTDPTRLEWIAQPVKKETTAMELEVPPFPEESPPAGYVWHYETVSNKWIPVYKGIDTRYTPSEGEYIEDKYGRRAYWNERTDSYEYPPDWNVDPETLRAEYISPFQQWQMEEAGRTRAFREAQLAQQAAIERERILASLTGPRDWVKYWQMRHGGLPATPEWLPEHLIGRTGAGVPAAGEPIKPMPVRTPSPQLYGGMTPTAQQGLAGYADWAAPTSRTWLDILGHHEQMLPEEVPGARFAQWQPTRQ